MRRILNIVFLLGNKHETMNLLMPLFVFPFMHDLHDKLQHMCMKYVCTYQMTVFKTLCNKENCVALI